MGEAFPSSIIQPDEKIAAATHHEATLNAMGIGFATLSIGLFYRFCGKFL